mgnify:CR=1 FL=1
MSSLPPLSLYIHVPWCVRKCPYCDFNSHTSPQSLPEDEYIAALLLDIDQDLTWLQGRAIQVYLLEAVHRHWPQISGRKITQ